MAIGACGAIGAGAGVGRLRSNTVSLIGSASDLDAPAPSRGPSSFDTRARGGAAARTSLNFESFCWRAGAGGAGAGMDAGVVVVVGGAP
jgi:hypothetical protein